MSGMTSEAAQVRTNVRLADLGFVATIATLKNDLGFGARIALNLVRISARADVTGAGTVAPLTTESRRILALKGLDMRRLHEVVVGIFVASLADFDADILGRVCAWRSSVVLGMQPWDGEQNTGHDQ
jgi:hypothetical protein